MQSHDIASNGLPPVGTNVEVRWNDNALYRGIYQGHNTVLMYLVSSYDIVNMSSRS